MNLRKWKKNPVTTLWSLFGVSMWKNRMEKKSIGNRQSNRWNDDSLISSCLLDRIRMASKVKEREDIKPFT